MKNGVKKLALHCLVVLIALGLLIPAAGCGEAEPVVESWDIPVISVLSGAIAFVGNDNKWAVEYTADEINAAGGIEGIPISFTYYDTAFDNAKAVSAMARAVEGSLVVLGPVDGPGAEAAGTIAAEEGVPFIAALASTEALDRFEPWGISYMQDDALGEAPAVTEWINLNTDIKSVVVFYDPAMPVMVEQFQAVEAALNKLGVEVLGPIEVQTGQVDMGPAAVRAMDLNPDGYYAILGLEYASLATELYNRGMTEGRRICASWACMTPVLFEQAAGYLENTYIFDKMDVGYEGAKWQTVVEDYQAEHEGMLPMIAVIPNYYDVLYALKAAFEELGITGDPDKLAEEREKISEFLFNSPEFEGIQGTFKWVNGQKLAPYHFFQVQNNMLVKISTIGG